MALLSLASLTIFWVIITIYILTVNKLRVTCNVSRHEKRYKPVNLVCGHLLWIIVDFCSKAVYKAQICIKKSKEKLKGLGNNKTRVVLNYYMLFNFFLTHILVNCLEFTAKIADISNPQNLVCGQIWTFFMSELVSLLCKLMVKPDCKFWESPQRRGFISHRCHHVSSTYTTRWLTSRPAIDIRIIICRI